MNITNAMSIYQNNTRSWGIVVALYITISCCFLYYSNNSPQTFVNNPGVLEEALQNTNYNSISTYRYNFTIPFSVKSVAQVCRGKGCSKQVDNYFMHQNLERLSYHMQNACQLNDFSSMNRLGFNMVVTCPIVKSQQLVGFVMISTYNKADTKELHNFSRNLADKIAAK